MTGRHASHCSTAGTTRPQSTTTVAAADRTVRGRRQSPVDSTATTVRRVSTSCGTGSAGQVWGEVQDVDHDAAHRAPTRKMVVGSVGSALGAVPEAEASGTTLNDGTVTGPPSGGGR
jgi:hypothetical protein